MTGFTDAKTFEGLDENLTERQSMIVPDHDIAEVSDRRSDRPNPIIKGDALMKRDL